MLGLAGCGETSEEPEMFAFIAPDNQTGDASVDWSTDIVHRGLAATVSGISANTVAEARMALVQPPTRLVYSTLTRTDTPGEVRLHSVIFDLPEHQFNREFTVTGNVLQAINRMATSIHPATHPLGATSEEVLKKWPIFRGDNLEDYGARCVALAESDPGFGAALGSCAEQLRASSRREVLEKFLSRIQFDRGHEFAPVAMEAFGQGYMALKDYSRSAAVFRAAAVQDARQKNMVGYSEGLAGRYESAKQALEEYAQLTGEQANALDSLGEVSFFCGKYKEAEQYFQAAELKFLTNQQGVLEPMKAAAARAMAGDIPGANRMADAYFEKIGKSNPQLAAQLKPGWTAIAGASSPELRQKLIESELIKRP